MNAQKFPLLKDSLSNFLVPQACVVCGAPSGRCIPLCRVCETQWLALQDVPGDRCIRCGRLLISAHVCCIDCRTVTPLQIIDRVYPLYSYDRTAQELLAAWKIGGCFGLTGFFARRMAGKLAEFPDIPVVPVPPRPGKIRKKGWDQIDRLARKLEKSYGIPVCRCLNRSSGIQQKKLGRKEREINLRGSIGMKKGMSVTGTVIVLDDIMTTGATLESCAAALRESGAEHVYGLTLFYD